MALEHQDERETVEAKREPRGAPDGAAPDSPTDVGLMPTLKRTFKEFSADNITDWAAALTYYSVQAIFPAHHRAGVDHRADRGQPRSRPCWTT